MAEPLIKFNQNGQWDLLEKSKGSGVTQRKLSDLYPNLPYTAKKEKLTLHKNGQWELGPDKIKPGEENSRKEKDRDPKED